MKFLQWHLNKDRINWRKWRKIKKIHLKNDKVELALLYNFLMISIPFKLCFLGRKRIWPDVLKRKLMRERKQLLLCFLFVYTQRKKDCNLYKLLWKSILWLYLLEYIIPKSHQIPLVSCAGVFSSKHNSCTHVSQNHRLILLHIQSFTKRIFFSLFHF